MAFETIDRYLLGEPVSKADAVAAVLAERSPQPGAAPFYRAFEAVGVRAADEAFIALRLAVAGLEPSDDNVRRLRAISSLARACAAGDRAGVRTAFERNTAVLGDLAAERGAELPVLAAAAASAYRKALEPA